MKSNVTEVIEDGETFDVGCEEGYTVQTEALTRSCQDNEVTPSLEVIPVTCHKGLSLLSCSLICGFLHDVLNDYNKVIRERLFG